MALDLAQLQQRQQKLQETKQKLEQTYMQILGALGMLQELIDVANGTAPKEDNPPS